MSDTSNKGPFVTDVTAGKYAWCACGATKNPPYCDGSHKELGTNIKPVVVEIEEDKKVAWCGCGKTGNAPFCDGTHSKQ